MSGPCENRQFPLARLRSSAHAYSCPRPLRLPTCAPGFSDDSRIIPFGEQELRCEPGGMDRLGELVHQPGHQLQLPILHRLNRLDQLGLRSDRSPPPQPASRRRESELDPTAIILRPVSRDQAALYQPLDHDGDRGLMGESAFGQLVRPGLPARPGAWSRESERPSVNHRPGSAPRAGNARERLGKLLRGSENPAALQRGGHGPLEGLDQRFSLSLERAQSTGHAVRRH